MSKKRTVAKYSLAAAVTGLYSGAVWKAYTVQNPKPVSPGQVAIVAGALAGATLICAAL